jgi:hypothetical protein
MLAAHSSSSSDVAPHMSHWRFTSLQFPAGTVLMLQGRAHPSDTAALSKTGALPILSIVVPAANLRQQPQQQADCAWHPFSKCRHA